MNAIFINIKKGFFVLLCCYPTIAIASQSFIRLGAEHEYSNNIYKHANNEAQNNRLKADIELNYKRFRETNSVSLSYNAEYQDESNSQLENSSFWTGQGVLSQQIFNKNFIFGAQHERQRFIIDQTKTSLASNQTERDLFAAEQYWHIPYSQRAYFSLHIKHARAQFHDYTSKNSENNTGDLSWTHKFNKKIKFAITYAYNDNNFQEDNNSYQKQQISSSLRGKYQLGLYMISFGHNTIKETNNEYAGINYRLMIDTLIRQHFFVFTANRALTNSSFRDGNENELDFFQNQLLWSTQTSLTHQYSILGERLLSKSQLYYNFDESSSGNNTEKSTQTIGFDSQLNWKIDEQWNLLIFAHYRRAVLYTGAHKRFLKTTLSGRFNMTQSLSLQMSVNWENETLTNTGVGYDETSYINRITYTF